MNAERKGSVLGAALLIAGSCIGAGMLGLPIVAGMAGFLPSLLVFFAAWAYMTASAFLLVEITGWYGVGTNYTSMAEKTLGRMGKGAVFLLYLFVFYALLVAYIAGTGGIVSTFFRTYLSIPLPLSFASLFFTLLFGLVVLKGTAVVDWWNRLLMALKILSYAAMVFVGFSAVEGPLLLHVDFRFTLTALPVLIIAFGFHNMIPSLNIYLGGDKRRLKRAIMMGSLFSLLVYLVWEIVVLGVLPIEGPQGIIECLTKGKEASQAVAGRLGVSLLATFATLLGFFALLTSFLAQALALVHFLGDAFKSGGEKHESLPLMLVALLPPLFLSLFYPEIFFAALNFAGGVCAVILFGLLPVLMVWKGRYRLKQPGELELFGGKRMLVLLFAFSLFILFFQLSSMVGAPYIPSLRT